MKFTIPLVPTAQKRARFSTRGGFAKAYKHKDQREAELDIMWFARENAPEEPLQGGIKLKVIAYLPIPKSTSKKKRALMELGQVPHIKRPDTDNYIKNIMDCMTKLRFWNDDSQVFEIHAVKRYEDNLGPRWEVELEIVE